MSQRQCPVLIFDKPGTTYDEALRTMLEFFVRDGWMFDIHYVDNIRDPDQIRFMQSREFGVVFLDLRSRSAGFANHVHSDLLTASHKDHLVVIAHSVPDEERDKFDDVLFTYPIVTKVEVDNFCTAISAVLARQ
jgi:hypothetical protein